MEQALQDILPYMAAAISSIMLIILFFLFYLTIRSQSKAFNYAAVLSKEDTVPNAGRISSDIKWHSSGVFTKSIELRLFRIGGNDEKPIAVVNSSMNFFSKLSQKISSAKVRGTFVIDGSSIGRVACTVLDGKVVVKNANGIIGTIDLNSKIIFDSENKPYGKFDREELSINGADVIDIPFISRKKNFSVSYPVFIEKEPFCTINYRKWSDYEEPLLQKMSSKIAKDDFVIVFSLAIFDWLLSTNLRED